MKQTLLRPRIGISFASDANTYTTVVYVLFAAKAGANPIILRANPPFDPAVLDGLDGLILTGGVDIHPNRYGVQFRQSVMDTLTIDDSRDAYELPLAKAALAMGMPVLGICRGFQMLNVALGGRLIQHFPVHRGVHPVNQSSHVINVVEDSDLMKILGEKRPKVNSWHHQGIREVDLATKLKAVATVSGVGDVGGLIEAFEGMGTNGWVMGTQWHPERVSEVPNRARYIASYLVAHANFYAERNKRRRPKAVKRAVAAIAAAAPLSLAPPQVMAEELASAAMVAV